MNYIERVNIPYKGDKVCFVKNGIILGSIYLSDYDFSNDRKIEVIDAANNKLIDLEKSSGIIEKLKLEEYIFGVVSGEMPAIFKEESLKAQAVIARTYALKRLSRNLPIKNFNSTQIYRDHNYLKDIWGDKYDEYRIKILKAIRDTKDEVIKFDGDYIDAYYHLASNGQTEDSRNVLKLAYPYLVSVPSNWDIDKDKVSYRVIPNNYLSKLLNMKITKDISVDIIMKTIGHRVKYIKFGNKVFDGLILSSRLGLDSNDFTVSILDDYTTFTTFGHGHGLGLSKYGAEAMARAGYSYRQIIAHYYPNTYIEKVSY
jgi:stage II sporulation protein D